MIKKHLQINIKGLVQGVGFRPFTYRLAKQYHQTGWVANTEEGLTIEIEGKASEQSAFISALQKKAPPFTLIESIIIHTLPPADFTTFQFKNSIHKGKKSCFVLPDIATCPDCVVELFDKNHRFYRYPFISCCHCGPRYSIMHSQPYDRSKTSMADFPLCQHCQDDYHNLDNRRFHAQTLACEQCGPRISLLDSNGSLLTEKEQALNNAVQQMQKGKILAVKGIGGYQLLTDANNEQAITLLRQRKHRPQKPFALMLPDLESAHKLCQINAKEEALLTSAEAPIVLLQQRDKTTICQAIAPHSPLLGIMLPYSPLHHLLLHDFNGALVVTSGNRESEPICINNAQALNKLKGIADFFLTHQRHILRPLDDSIVRIVNDNTTLLRRARGYVPKPITIKNTLPHLLAVGGQLKNTVAISRGKQIIMSQHLGDLNSIANQNLFKNTITDLLTFYSITPHQIMHDAHPGYSSSQYAEQQNTQHHPVQHHYAHSLACMAEHGIDTPALSICWDGSGLGTDNQLWGGEFLFLTEQGFKRFAHLQSFPLPGGSKAILEPRRTALGLLYELYADDSFKRQNIVSLASFTQQELQILKIAMDKKINSPQTTSIGRLFDAVASLTGLCQINNYEGEAAMQLESAANLFNSDLSYSYQLHQSTPSSTIKIKWQPMIKSILHDCELGQQSSVAAKFHNTLADITLDIAQLAKQPKIILTGGCFQNALLLKKVKHRLKNAGFIVFQHQQSPPNDGGLALGQLLASRYL